MSRIYSLKFLQEEQDISEGDEVDIIVPGLGLCTARICFLVPGLLAPNTTALEILSMKLSLSMRDAQWLHIRKGGESILHHTW